MRDLCSRRALTAARQKDKKKTVRDVTAAILARKPKMCNFIEWKDIKIVYKRCGRRRDAQC